MHTRSFSLAAAAKATAGRVAWLRSDASAVSTFCLTGCRTQLAEQRGTADPTLKAYTDLGRETTLYLGSGPVLGARRYCCFCGSVSQENFRLDDNNGLEQQFAFTRVNASVRRWLCDRTIIKSGWPSSTLYISKLARSISRPAMGISDFLAR